MSKTQLKIGIVGGGIGGLAVSAAGGGGSRRAA